MDLKNDKSIESMGIALSAQGLDSETVKVQLENMRDGKRKDQIRRLNEKYGLKDEE